MEIYFFLFFLLFAVFVPARFHLHVHGRGQKFFFFVELSLAGLRFWNYTFSISLELPKKTGSNMKKDNGTAIVERTEKPAAPSGLVPLPGGLNRLYTLLSRYGVGGTFFYLFLPSRYRRWMTVAQEMEKRGKFSRFAWGTVLGLEDAALTGTATGILWGMKGTMIGLLQRSYKFDRNKPHVMVLPSYNIPGWETMLDCIFDIKVGHIILGGIKGFIHSNKGEN